MPTVLRASVLSSFTCLGDKCEDTCCQGWSMQVDAPTHARYEAQAPELLPAVEREQDGASWIMRKDPASSACVKLEGGLCGIQRDYGNRFLGDACHFYPRSVRGLGERAVMSAMLSCPEIARLALFGDAPGSLHEAEMERFPATLKNYLPEGLTLSEALAIHRLFLSTVADAEAGVERVFLRLASVARSLERIEQKSWPAMTPYYIAQAESRLPMAENNHADPFNLLHALSGLVVASHKPLSPRLRQTIGTMEQALAVTLDWQRVSIHTTDASLPAYRQLRQRWQEQAAAYQPILARWLHMQLSVALAPFAGLGGSLSERMAIIGVRLATVRLALMCHQDPQGTLPPPETVVRVVQSLSRLLDHLGDSGFSLRIYAETGWLKENRLRGLLEI